MLKYFKKTGVNKVVVKKRTLDGDEKDVNNETFETKKQTTLTTMKRNVGAKNEKIILDFNNEPKPKKKKMKTLDGFFINNKKDETPNEVVDENDFSSISKKFEEPLEQTPKTNQVISIYTVNDMMDFLFLNNQKNISNKPIMVSPLFNTLEQYFARWKIKNHYICSFIITDWRQNEKKNEYLDYVIGNEQCFVVDVSDKDSNELADNELEKYSRIKIGKAHGFYYNNEFKNDFFKNLYLRDYFLVKPVRSMYLIGDGDVRGMEPQIGFKYKIILDLYLKMKYRTKRECPIWVYYYSTKYFTWWEYHIKKSGDLVTKKINKCPKPTGIYLFLSEKYVKIDEIVERENIKNLF